MAMATGPSEMIILMPMAQGANVNGIVSGLTLDTADLLLDGRRVLPPGQDDLLLLERGTLRLRRKPTLEAVRLYVDFTVDFEAVGFPAGARLFFSHLLFRLNDYQLRLGKPPLESPAR